MAAGMRSSDDGHGYNQRIPGISRRAGVSGEQVVLWVGRTRERDEHVENFLFHSAPGVKKGDLFDNYARIPVESSGWAEGKEPALMQHFSEMKLEPPLVDNLTRLGCAEATPIQKGAVPAIMAGRDCMAVAQTGSGKTLATFVPGVDRILKEDKPMVTDKEFVSKPQMVMMVPTRELAQQAHFVACQVLYCTDKQAAVLHGGQPALYQRRELDAHPEVIVATPGRLADFVEKGRVSLVEVQVLLIDEGDTMTSHFLPDLQQVMEEIPAKETRMTIMCSATFPPAVQVMARDFLRDDYIIVIVGRIGSATDTVHQEVVRVRGFRKKVRELVELCKRTEGKVKLVFVRSKHSADELDKELSDAGIECIATHSGRNQLEREHAMVDVLVATDMMERGVDIASVEMVVNFDMPVSRESYLHRIGRTGRCGNFGQAVSFVSSDDWQCDLTGVLELMVESGNEPPPWFVELAQQSAQQWAPVRNQRGRRCVGYQRVGWGYKS